MTKSTWLHPSMWRVCIFTLIVGLAANSFLFKLADDDDWFAKVLSVASPIAAVLLFVCWYRFPKWIGEVLLLVFMIWTANGIEFALETQIAWYSRTRQCLLYASEALLALGAYVASRETSP